MLKSNSILKINLLKWIQLDNEYIKYFQYIKYSNFRNIINKIIPYAQFLHNYSKKIYNLMSSHLSQQTIRTPDIHTRYTRFNIYANLLICTLQTSVGYLCIDICLGMSLHFISKYSGTVQVAALSLAYTLIQILILPIGFGFNNSLNMHASQAIPNDKLARTYFTINMYILLSVLTPISLGLYLLKEPMKFLIQDDKDKTSEAAWEYLIYSLIANVIVMEFEGIKSFMIANKVTYPFPFIHISSTVAHYFFCSYLIKDRQLGIQGAGIALLLTESLNLLLLLLFIIFTRAGRRIFRGTEILLPRKRWQLVRIYFKASIPQVLHILCDFFAFFFLSLVALQLGTNDMNAYQFLQNTQGFLFKFAIGLSLALMAYVGTEMGSGNIYMAKRYTWGGIILYIFFAISFALFFYVFGFERWKNLYTEDKDVSNILEKVYLIMLINILAVNGFQGALTGALKGVQMIDLVLYSTIISYYIICIPLTLYLTFSWGQNLGQIGIQISFMSCNFAMVVLYIFALLFINWRRQSNRIKSKSEMDEALRGSPMVEVEDYSTK
ncbi:hypothetical protein pb186bvf_019965 [Paramecium bursaria]